MNDQDPRPFALRALFACAGILIAAHVAGLLAGSIGQYDTSDAIRTFTGQLSFPPYLFMWVAWSSARTGYRRSAVHQVRAYLWLAMIAGVAELLLRASWHGDALVAPLSLIWFWCIPVGGLLSLRSSSVRSWVAALPEGTPPATDRPRSTI